jgi:hypothetical protein
MVFQTPEMDERAYCEDSAAKECSVRLKQDTAKNVRNDSGIIALLNRYKAIFQTSENLEYYSKNDYETAERKFLIWCLEKRPIFLQEGERVSIESSRAPKDHQLSK